MVTLVALAFITSAFIFQPQLAAAKGIFGLGKKTATATTTLAYMTTGTATTTLTYDTYTDGLQTADSMALLVRFTASSTSSTLNIKQEFSQDGIDWYQSSQPAVFGNATTSIPVYIATVPQYVWTYASSTIGGIVVSASSDTRIIPVQSPTRFTRFVFTLPVGSTPGGVWAHVLPVKQNP